jgi:group II intron reverse transcriptase/maturase/CRISPR-associated endonuclease Cas1
MNNSNNADLVRPLAIFGRAAHATHLALRRVLKAKEHDQPLIVLDYQGAAASLLDATNHGNLYRTPLFWCDLANRRKPTAIFRMRRTAGFIPAIKAFLSQCAEFLTTPLSEGVVEWAAKLLWHLADQGTVGLSTLMRSLHQPETLQWFRREHGPNEINRLTNLLGWLMRFPSVWSTAEGNNRLDLQQALKTNGTVWLEMPSQHFERIEHQVVAYMAEAAVLNLILSQTPAADIAGTRTKLPIILYVYPTVPPLSFCPDATTAKHVGVFGLSGEHPFPKAAHPWLNANADCWVVGNVGRISMGTGGHWVSESELTRIRSLQAGELWVRSGKNGTAVTMRVRASERQAILAHQHRAHSMRGRRTTPIKQLSSAAAVTAQDAPEGIDLYRQLCRNEILLSGWQRVKTQNKESHGSDQVTISQFGTDVERELNQLIQDLESGKYRHRPLRITRIPKDSGGERTLKLACIRDRVIEAACLTLLEPIFEPRFSHFSFAYRPHRNAHHALAFARGMIRSGKVWAVIADIRHCFDSIDHDILLRLVGSVVGDRDFMRLLRNWLETDAFDFHGIVASELGVPQGSALSPLLANIYLDPLDKEFERTGITFSRYADDYLILCESKQEAEMALKLMTDYLHSVLNLELKQAKTQYCHVEQGAGFLGFVLNENSIRIQPDKLARATSAIHGHIKTIASPGYTLFAKSAALQHMNALIRGFRNYFLIEDAPQIIEQLREADAKIEEVAGKLLPISLRHEMAWLIRERMVTGEYLVNKDGSAATDPTNMLGLYPRLHEVNNAHWISSSEISPTEPQVPGPKTPKPKSNAETPQTEDADEEQGGALIDGRLYVMSAGSFVTVQQNDLVVRRRKEELHRVPLDTLKLLVLQGPRVGISVDLTIQLSAHDVPVVFAPLFGRPAAIAASLQGGHSRLKQRQILRRNDPDILSSGISMLAAKAGNQASVLKYFARYRKKQGQGETHDSLSNAAANIRNLADQIRQLEPQTAGLRNMVMGYEGRAAALYWSSLAHLVPDDLSFPGRQTRQATDPFNQAVNYVYGVLYGEVWKATVNAGLDPYSGIMHGTEHDQGSLIFDLIEEFRAPFGDRLVLGMLGRGFQPQLDRHGNLRTSTRRMLVKAFHRIWSRPIRWRSKMISPSRILEQQVKNMARTFLGEDTYRPFQFRW